MSKFDINDYHRHAPRPHRRIMQVEPIVCADGFTMSVQASKAHYCEPRANHAWPYVSFEVGFPSRHEPLLDPYGERGDEPSDVFGWVPAETINDIVFAHGGLLK